MSEIGRQLLALAGGVALGAFFFGGLWWTVTRLSTFTRPALMVVASLLLRTGITVAGFLVLSSGQWQRLLLCLAGFTVARVICKHAVRRQETAA